MIGAREGIETNPACRYQNDTEPETVIEKQFSIRENGLI
jgi:hypothetical protein